MRADGADHSPVASGARASRIDCEFRPGSAALRSSALDPMPSKKSNEIDGLACGLNPAQVFDPP
jgi:hypothetical protein